MRCRQGDFEMRIEYYVLTAKNTRFRSRKRLFEGRDNAIIAARLTEVCQRVVGKIAAAANFDLGDCRKSRGGILEKKKEKKRNDLEGYLILRLRNRLVGCGSKEAGWTDDVAPRNLQRLSSGQFFVKSLKQTFAFSCDMLSQDTDNLKVRLHC
jgi:hypothetical protein